MNRAGELAVLLEKSGLPGFMLKTTCRFRYTATMKFLYSYSSVSIILFSFIWAFLISDNNFIYSSLSLHSTFNFHVDQLPSGSRTSKSMNEGAAEVKFGYTKLSGNRALTSLENRVL